MTFTIPADVFASEVAKVLPGSNFPKIPGSPKSDNIGRDQISARFDRCRCCRIFGFRNFGKNRAWQHFSNLGCENIGKDQTSTKFLKPEMRKHRQGSNFRELPKI